MNKGKKTAKSTATTTASGPATRSRGKPAANAPANKALAKKTAAKGRHKASELAEPVEPPSSPAPAQQGKRKRNEVVEQEESEEDQMAPPSPKSLAAFRAWKDNQASEKPSKSDAAKQKAAKAAKDKAIQDANALLLAAEDQGAGGDDNDGSAKEDGPHPTKKPKISIVLDADEEDAAMDLSAGLSDDDEPSNPVQQMEEDDEGDIFEEEAIDISPVKKPSSKIGRVEVEISDSEDDDDDDDDDEPALKTNGVAIKNASLKPPSFSSQIGSRASSRAPSTRGGKVTRNVFEGEHLKALADAAKSMVRMKILYGDWDVTYCGKSGSQEWATGILQTVAKEKPSMQRALKAAFQDEATKEDLLTYIIYGKGALLNAFITKARFIVATNYGLNGRQEVIAERVMWLLKKTQFTYGGIDIEAKTFEQSKIWGNPMIKELLQVVLFSQGAKADACSAQEIRKRQALPISAIILAITATEHAIGEYRDGTCRQYPFKESTIRKRYTHHERNWISLEKLSQKWAKFYLQGVFQAIIATVGLVELGDDQDDDQMEGITSMDLDNIADSGATPF